MQVLDIRAYHIGRSMLRINNNTTPIALTSLLSFATLLLQPCNCLQSQTWGASWQHFIINAKKTWEGVALPLEQ